MVVVNNKMNDWGGGGSKVSKERMRLLDVRVVTQTSKYSYFTLFLTTTMGATRVALKQQGHISI